MSDNPEIKQVDPPIEDLSIEEPPKYVLLSETNEAEMESWYYFIKYEGNEESLKYLDEQLNMIDMYLLENLSAFDLDLEHFVSPTTAKEMTKVEINSYAFHRKFDGKLQTINLELRKKDSNDRMIKKTHRKLGYGKIEEFIDQEDIDPEDLVSSDSDLSNSEDSEDNELLVPLPKSGPKKLNLNKDPFRAGARRVVKKHK